MKLTLSQERGLIPLIGSLKGQVLTYVEDEGHIIGVIVDVGPGGWLCFVSPFYRRRGIATQMARSLLADKVTGYIVASTTAGMKFVSHLERVLTVQEKQYLEVPAWKRP